MFIAGIILEYNEHNPVGIEVLQLLYDKKNERLCSGLWIVGLK